MKDKKQLWNVLNSAAISYGVREGCCLQTGHSALR